MDLALVRGLDECFRSGCEDKSVGELIEFKDNVNSETITLGRHYSLILALISLGKVFERIRTSSKCQLRGVFDGQGHVISNLNMNSSSSSHILSYSDTQKD